MALLEGTTEALARRLGPSTIPPERDPEPFPTELLLVEAVARSAGCFEPERVLVEASNGTTCLGAFARLLLPSRVEIGGPGQAIVDLATVLDGFYEDVRATVDEVIDGRWGRPHLSWFGSIDQHATRLADGLRARLMNLG